MRRLAIIGAVMTGLATAAAADMQTGMTAFEQGDFDTAVAQLTPVADKGDARAQFILGVMYLNGFGVGPDAYSAAERFRQAAEQDHLGAQLELAKMYREGDGVPQDFAEMVRWYRRAAEGGDVGAQLSIADAYAYGIGIDADPVEAYMWYLIAMEYWGDMIEPALDVVAEKMTAAEIDEGRRRAEGWLKSAKE